QLDDEAVQPELRNAVRIGDAPETVEDEDGAGKLVEQGQRECAECELGWPALVASGRRASVRGSRCRRVVVHATGAGTPRVGHWPSFSMRLTASAMSNGFTRYGLPVVMPCEVRARPRSPVIRAV